MVLLAAVAPLVGAQHVVSTDGQRIIISAGAADGVKKGMTGKLCRADIVNGDAIQTCSALFTVVSTQQRRATVRVTKDVGRDVRSGYEVKFDQKLVPEEKKPPVKSRAGATTPRPVVKADDVADRAFREADRAYQSDDCRGALERYELILQKYPQHQDIDLAADRAESCRRRLVQINLPPSIAPVTGPDVAPPSSRPAPPVAVVLPLATREAEDLAATAEKLLRDGKLAEARSAARAALRKDSTNTRAHTISRAISVKSQARFNSPTDVALGPDGWCYVADSGNSAIRKVAAASTSTLAGEAGQHAGIDGPQGRARFNEPIGVATGNDGVVYVADRYAASIRRITPNGMVSTIAGRNGTPGFVDGIGSVARFNEPRRLVVDRDGTVYVSDTGNHAIRKIDPNGRVVTFARATAGDRMDPQGIAISSAGGLIVADTWAHVVRLIDPDGAIRTLAGVSGIAGSNDGPITSASFNAPEDVAVTPDGTIYVADSGNHSIRRIAKGVVSTVAGRSGIPGFYDGAASAARFNNPTGLAVDPSGRLWIADRANQTIRLLADDFVITVAGLAKEAGSSDGAN